MKKQKFHYGKNINIKLKQGYIFCKILWPGGGERKWCWGKKIKTEVVRKGKGKEKRRKGTGGE